VKLASDEFSPLNDTAIAIPSSLSSPSPTLQQPDTSNHKSIIIGTAIGSFIGGIFFCKYFFWNPLFIYKK